MNPDRMRYCLEVIGYSQRQLARILDWQDGEVRQWARGTVAIPDDVAAWLEALTAAHEAHKVPRKGNDNG